MKLENKRIPQTVLNNMKISVKVLDSKPLKYSNDNHRMSHGNLQKVDEKKYIDIVSSQNNLARSYNTGLLISHFPPESKKIFLIYVLKNKIH